MPNTPKVALITGAARRIGAEIAETLHAAGMNVVLHYHRSEAEAKTLCARFNQQRAHSAVLVQADLADLSGLESVIQKTVQEWGRLDVLINNASRFDKTKVGEVTQTLWQDLLNTNLAAPFFLSQAAAKHLAKFQGCIVNIADVHGERPMRDYAVYCMTKAGIVMLTKALAKELGPTIRVNAVAPGTVVPPEGENTLSEERAKKILSRTVLHRYGSAADVAKAVKFLIFEADFITGQVVSVDGGRLLSM